MNTVSLGTKKKSYRSVKEFADANGLKYITAYMRLRMGDSPNVVVKKPVRQYNRKQRQ